MTGDTSRDCDIPLPHAIQKLSIKVFLKVSALCWGLSLSVCLMGCAPAKLDPVTDQSVQKNTLPPSTSPQAQTKPKPVAELAQYLPINAVANIAGREIQLEVANTIAQQEKGLMFRPPLADDRGMLFPYQPARLVAFWMKNTPSPLDIIFLLDGKVQAIARNATTCRSDPCPVYPANGVVADNVIEVRAGLTQEIGLQEGDQIAIKFLLPKNE